jgi:hypothetical protein
MNRSMFWRLVWKEYRLQRALWIAMFVLTALVMGLCVMFCPPRDRPVLLYWAAAGLPACCLLGSGAMLFAGEREAGTYEFQRTLPVGAGRVVAAKFVFVLVAATVLSGLLWLAAFFLSGRTLPPPEFNARQGLVMLSLFGGEMLVWATLFSLLSQRVLVAAVLGVVAASLSVQLLPTLIIDPDVGVAAIARFWTITPARIILATAVALVDVWLGVGWFRQRSDRRLRFGGAGLDTSAASPATVMSGRLGAPQRMAIVGRLVWQHWRQSVWLTSVILAVDCLFLALIGKCLRRHIDLSHLDFRGDPIILYLGILPILVCIPLLGLSAFLPDQWGASYRFLTDRGVAAKHVWLSRQLVVWMPLVLLLPVLLALAVLLAPTAYSPQLQDYVRYTTTACACVFGYVVIGVAVGQFCSMVFRSSILAGLFTVLLSAILAAWCMSMLFWDVNWLWSVLPIPLALLLATRLRTRDWLLERNTLRAWLGPALALVVPAAALLTTVPLYRIHQVPDIAPCFSVETYERPMMAAERATMDLYRQAVQAMHRDLLDSQARPMLFGGRQLPPSQWEIGIINNNQKAIALALRASRGSFVHPIGEDPELRRIQDLGQWVVLAAVILENEGKLDAALEHYMAAIRIYAQVGSSDLHGAWSADRLEPAIYAHLRRWAARPQQTAARLLAAQRQLTKTIPRDSLTAPLKLEYLYLRRILEGDMAGTTRIISGKVTPLSVGVMLWLQLPWERARALRLLNLQTRLELLAAEQYYGAREPLLGMAFDPESLAALRWMERSFSRSRPTELFYVLRQELSLTPISYYSWEGREAERRRWFSTLAETIWALETMRNATRLVLALEAWKLEHGSLPKRLEELVGHGLDRLPLDPYSGEPFRYFPAGLKLPLHPAQPLGRTGWSSGGTVPAQTPFLWSTGMNARKASFQRTKDLVEQYEIRQDPWSGWHMPRSDFDVWESGWPCPIP